MTARILCGGQRLDSLAADDRGVAYGDGVFETMLVHDGQPVWWHEHWDRLRRGADMLGIPVPDEAAIRDEIETLIAEAARVVLKLILTRGRGGRGYAPPTDAKPTVILSLHDAPLPTPVDGIAVRWCKTQLAVQPALAGIKHCNRLEQVLARAEWRDPGIFEGLMCDSDGCVVSATAANLFVRRDGHWLTPTVQRCGVAGIARGWLLANLAQVSEAELGRTDVESADAVFLCNAVRGILPVRRLGSRHWPVDAGMEEIRRQLAQAQPAFSFQEH